MAQLKARIEARIENGGKIELPNTPSGRQNAHDICRLLVGTGYIIKVSECEEVIDIIFWKE